LHRRRPGLRVRGGSNGDGDLTRRPLPAWLGRGRTVEFIGI
jgi:hypothetical protein